jgi:hypothetical protein
MFFFGAVFGCCPVYENYGDDNDPISEDKEDAKEEKEEDDAKKPDESEKKGPVPAPALASSNLAARTLSPTRKSTLKRAAATK